MSAVQIREVRQGDLESVLALYAAIEDSPADVLTLVENRIGSVRGVIIQPALNCAFEQIGPHFWRMDMPAMADAHLHSLVQPLLSTLESYIQISDQNFDLQRRLTRTARDLAQAQQDYQRATSALARQVQNLTQTEARLRSSESQLKHIIDLLPQQIYAVDDQDHIILANKSLADAFDLNAEDLSGVNIHDLMHQPGADNIWPNSTDQANIDVRRDNTRIDLPDHMLATPAGQRFFHVTKIPFPLNGNEQLRVLTVATDITEHKEAEQAIRHLNQELEQRVMHRTADLARANASLHDAKEIGRASCRERVSSPV